VCVCVCVCVKLSCYERVKMNHTGSLTLAWLQCRAENKEKERERFKIFVWIPNKQVNKKEDNLHQLASASGVALNLTN